LAHYLHVSLRPAFLDDLYLLCYVGGIAAPVNVWLEGRVSMANGVVMKLIALLVASSGAAFALGQGAAAQTGECRSVADPATRLACYDKAAASTPAPNATTAAARPPVAARPQAATVDSGRHIDSISDEDAQVNAKLHGICRGC
jgi:hypothetical protein